MTTSNPVRTSRFGVILVILNLLGNAMSSWGFLVDMKLSIPDWLSVNSCAPSALLLTLGFFLEHFAVLGASLPFFIFYALISLVIFPIDAGHYVPQFGHIVMLVTAAWVVTISRRYGRMRELWRGISAGLIAFIPIVAIQIAYHVYHPNMFAMMGASPAIRRLLGHAL